MASNGIISIPDFVKISQLGSGDEMAVEITYFFFKEGK
jgi:hypothetical protein